MQPLGDDMRPWGIAISTIVLAHCSMHQETSDFRPSKMIISYLAIIGNLFSVVVP